MGQVVLVVCQRATHAEADRECVHVLPIGGVGGGGANDVRAHVLRAAVGGRRGRAVAAVSKVRLVVVLGHVGERVGGATVERLAFDRSTGGELR
ncbi:hypothetical protein D3C85_1291080 [compost metagenome]